MVTRPNAVAVGLILLAGAVCAHPVASHRAGSPTGRTPSPVVRVGVDERAELLAIIWRLAGSSAFSQGRFEPYVGDIEHLGPHKDHEAVQAARALRSAGIDHGAVMMLAIHLTNPYEMRLKVPLDTTGGALDLFRADSAMRAKITQGVDRFLPVARRFVVDARAREFFVAHRSLYDSAGARMRRMVERHADIAWFDRFVGRAPENDFVVVPLLATNEANFGAPLPGLGVRAEVYAFLGVRGSTIDAGGWPVYDEEMMATLVHEFGHSYFNPLVAARFEQLERAGQAIRAAFGDAMREQGYQDWRSIMFEGVVRAAVVRYVLAHNGPAAARRAVADEQRRGYLWTAELANLLGQYEAARSQYPTLESFMPRIVTYFDSLPPRIATLQREYDTRRPKIVSVSIEQDADAVDPALTEIVIRFDRRVRRGWGSVSPVRGGRDRFPRFTREELDSTGTRLGLAVSLEPARLYEFQLGSASGHGFLTADHVPLAPYVLRFRTRSAQ